MLRPVSEFTKTFLNAVPSLEDVAQITPSLRQLYTMLEHVQENGVAEEIATSGVADLMEGCVILARNDQLLEQKKVTCFITTVFLNGSKHNSPEYDAERNEQFDRIPSWGSSSPRVNAAEGLMLIARNVNALTDEIRNAIKRLSNDKVNAVRYMVAKNLRLLSSADPDLMWDLVEKFSKNDTSLAVLHVLANRVLYGLTGKYAERTVPIAKSIFDRTTPIQGSADPQEACVSLFVGAYIDLGSSQAEHIVFSLLEDISRYHSLLARVGGILRSRLIYAEEERNEERRAAYSRAWKFMDALCDSSVKKWHELVDKYDQTSSAEIPEEVTIQWRQLGSLIDSLATDIFFASGAHEEKRKADSTEGKLVDRRRRCSSGMYRNA